MMRPRHSRTHPGLCVLRLLALFLCLVCLTEEGVGQGSFNQLDTSAGEVLISDSVGFSFGADLVDPGITMKVGFSTDEVFQPGGFFDSFSVTLQSLDATITIVIATLDVSGVVWAPPTPGATPIDAADFRITPFGYPSLNPMLTSRDAFDIQVSLPDEVIGRQFTAYFDLFNNQDGTPSQAFFQDFAVVPEPGVLFVLVPGLVVLVIVRRRNSIVRSTALSAGLVMFIAVFVAPSKTQAQQEQLFQLNGADITLAEATPDVEVYFTSMRLNRALNVWNVEVALTNSSSRVLTGPLVLMVDSFIGTSGVQQPDGVTSGGKAFYDLSTFAGGNSLAPGQGTAKRTLTLGLSVGSPALTTRFYVARPPVAAALGVTRSLNGVGQPLPDVRMDIGTPTGTRQKNSDAPSGVASFGEGPGEHLIRFSSDGYLPVWRRQVLESDKTTVVPNPRLVEKSRRSFNVTPLGGVTGSNRTGSVMMNIGAGLVSQATTVTLTSIDGQNLPAFLPLGWSPLNAFWFESELPLTGDVSAQVALSASIDPTEMVALVKWNEVGLQWLVTQIVPGNSADPLSVVLNGTGAYALVVGDIGTTAPPAAQIGQGLMGYSLPSPVDAANLSARGEVVPSASPASVVPEKVTGTARLEVRDATGPLPSGYLVRGEVTETYLLSDGSLRLTPQYEQFIVGYQRPGDADPNTLQAEFPMRPVLLFGVDRLEEATLRMDVLPDEPFDGAVLDDAGGQLSDGGIRILAGSGRLTGPSALRLRRLDGTVFTNLMSEGHVVAAAFDLTVDRSTLGDALAAQLSGAPTNTLYVLARVLSDVGVYGLQPIERLATDANGNFISLEPATGERLPGLRGSGQFVLVQVSEPQGLISGVAENGAGQPQAGMPVRLTGLPWLTLTDEQGRYQLVGPVGGIEIGVTDQNTGDTGFVAITVSDPALPVNQDLGTAPAGPRVASITPNDGAVKVPRVGSVVVRFNEAVNPGTIVGGAIQLLKPDDSVVSAALSLNLANTVATLSPAVELDANTIYRVRLATTIADPTGLLIEGALEFSFTTVPLSTRVATAQLVIYEPGATNVPTAILDDIPAFTPGEDPFAIVVHGQPGVADPDVPVILVNESTGETQTVLSKLDGSFSSFISGTEEDFISATFVNLNGTRVYVPVSRQEFDNGFVGLYPQGGILEAESDGGAVQVLVEPGAIPQRSKFEVRVLSFLEIQELTEGTQPLNGSLIPRGLTITRDGDHMEIPADLSIPVDVSELNLPDGLPPEEGVYGLCAVSRVDGEIAYHLLDDMVYEDGKLVTKSFPFFQLLIGGVFTLWETAAIVNGVPPTPSQPDPPRLPDPNPAASAVQQISLVMINFPLSRKVRVQGTVFACDVDSGNSCDSSDTANPRVAGAVVTFRTLNQSLGAALRGRLDAGAVFAVSDKNGKYALIADNPTLLDPIGTIDDDEGFLVLTATHPRYFGQRPARSVDLSATESVGFADLAFSFAGSSGTNTSPPFISASHTPANPGTNDVVEFTLLATHGAVIPSIQAPQVFSVTSLLPDISVQPSDITITGPVSQQNPGGFGRQEVFEIESTKAAIAILQVEAAVPNSQPRQLRYAIAFGGAGAPGTNVVQVVDYNDTVGPQVEVTFPTDNSLGVVPGQTITIVFNEPVDAGITNSTSGIQISPSVTTPTFELSRDQRELSFVLFDVNPDTDYSITVNSSIMDLAGNSFDQDPSTAANDSYTLVLRTAPVTETDKGQFADQSRGGGVVIKGIYAYALERAGANGNSLLVHDLSNPNEPELVARLPLPGYPRDLALIPDYSFVRKPGEPVERKDLLAVVGGDLGAAIDDDGNVAFAGQYLRLIDISDPASPRRLASRNITFSPVVAVTKIQWAPPVMAYLEFGIVCNDNVSSSQCIPNQQIGLVDLQSFIIGEFLTQEEFRELPPDPTPGADLNGDGDYVDPGETLPLPGSRPFEFAGKVGAITLDDSTQAIRDFVFDTSTGHLSVVLGDGKEVAPDGSIVPGTFRNPSFRILISGGSRIAVENWSVSSVEFPGLRPKRVFAKFGVLLVTGDESRTVDLAFVSVVPGSLDTNKVVVIDVTNPLSLTVLTEIEVDPNLGLVQSITEREDGMLRLATSHNTILIDPGRLNLPVVAGQSHPAVVGFIPRSGSGNQTLSGNLAGLNVVSLGGNNRVVQSAPWMQFVRAMDGTNVIDPESIVGDANGIAEVLSRIGPTDVIVPARHRTVTNVVTSTLDPPQAIGHYHVLVAAPGSAGPTISLSLESLNRAGFPLRNKGLGFPAVRAMSSVGLTQIGQTARDDCDVPMQALTAFRLSTNKSDANFNLYLSRPFALTYESMSAAELQTLQNGLNREILWSGHFLRASLDISLATNVVLKAFVGELDADKKVIRPGVSVVAQSLPADYIMGPNPPPHLGHDALPGTFNSVSGHNGEFRTDTVDIQLPSRRMPIRFERFVGAQDLYDGPFGRGWDFNYNQRLVEIDLSIVPEGYQVPLVITGSGKGELAQARDVLFHNGEGRTVWYRYEGEDAPTEYKNDPLAKDLDWLDRADAFYFPPPGVFDMLVRFPSGQFARLTPDGTQYWYSALGRLEKIHDKYPKNELRLEYNTRGDLRRVTDESVVAERYVEVGYWRLQNDIGSGQLDQVTSNPYVAGKVARLRDYTDRDIDFFYDECGVLTNRLGIDVSFAHPLGFSDRQSTLYVQAAGQSASVKANGIRGIVGGSGVGTALFMADVNSGGDAPEVTGGQAVGSMVTIDVQHQNTAAEIANGNGKTLVTGADGSVAEFLFETNGLPKEVKYTGPVAADAIYKYSYRDDGLLERITYPANNAVELTYSASDNLRSRANVETVKKIAGSNGGDPIPDATFGFDENYNIIVGTFKDHNGSDITVELTNDKRDVRKFSYPGAGAETFSFNEYGQLLTFTSIDGVEHEYDYDPVSGFLTTRKEGAFITTFIYGGGASAQRGLPSAIQPPRGAQYSATYDEREQLITWERGQQREQFSYDQNGNAVRMARRVDGSEEYIETSEYLQNGFLKKLTIEQLETDGSVQTLVTQFEPDNVFRIAKIILPNGEEQTFEEFDHLGQPHKMTLGGYEEKYTYDANNNLLTVTIGSTVHQYGYDGHDRLISEERPTGIGASEMVEYSYHGAGALKTLTLTDSAGELNQDISIEIDSYNRPRIVTIQTDSGAVQNNYTYDGTSRTTTLRTPSNETYTQTYDAAGRLIMSSDSLQTTTYTHDDNGNLERASMQEGLNTYQRIFTPINALDQSERFADNLGTVFSITRRLDGRAKSVTDALNHVTSYDYTKMGELTLEDRPEGVSINREYNKHRALASLTDTSDQGLTYSYDTSLRLESVRHRDNQSTTYGGFNARNQPTSITIPGGSITVGYDQQGRIVSRAINFLGEQRNESFTYDALSRFKSAVYPIGNVSLDYDLMGPLRKQTFTHNGVQYVVDRVLRNDGAVLGTRYPSGVTASQTRNPHGRLGGVFPSSGDAVVQQTTYVAADLVGSMTLGDGLIRIDNRFDARKRLLGRQYIRISDAEVLADVRSVYDAVDNRVAQQFVHRGGRIDFFQYDEGDRLTRADMGARPAISVAGLRIFPGFSVPSDVSGNWSAGFYARDYNYDNLGLDVLQSVAVINPQGVTIPPFGSSYGLPDTLLHIQNIDGFARSRDNLGNTRRVLLSVRLPGNGGVVGVGADLVYDGKSQLVRIVRDDGVQIDYEYQYDGLRCYRTVTGPPDRCIPGATAYVYDGDLLIEEWDRSLGQNRLSIRYYYADTIVPLAADFRMPDDSFERHYFLSDGMGSVIGLANQQAEVVERYIYDPYGQPKIEGADQVAPRVAQLVMGDGGSLILAFSESVLPPLPAAGTGGLVSQLSPLPGTVTVNCGGQADQGAIGYDEALPGFEFGSVLVFLPQFPIQGGCVVNIEAGRLRDEWGNLNAAEQISFTASPTSGTVVYDDSDFLTRAPVLSRSGIGSALLFHGQQFDYEAGLLYLRARFHDPGTGLFLQQDPRAYEDSVNPYAGFAHNPMTFSDPSGEATVKVPITSRGAAALIRPKSTPAAVPKVRIPDNPNIPVAKSSKVIPVKPSGSRVNNTPASAAKNGQKSVRAAEPQQRLASQTPDQTTRSATKLERPTQEQVRAMTARGRQIEKDLHNFAVQEGNNGRLKIVYKDLGEITVDGRNIYGKMGSHRYDPATDTSTVTINSRLRGDPMLEAKASSTLIHELSHARAALTTKSMSAAGVPRFVEELGAHLDQVAFEIAKFGRRGPYSSAARNHFFHGGKDAVGRHIFEKSPSYKKNFGADSYDQLVELNPLLFGRGQGVFE